MITVGTELRLIKRLTKDRPILTAQTIADSIRKVDKLLLAKYSESLDLQLEAELRRAEIEKSKLILEEIE